MPVWTLRPATPDDRGFLRELHRAAMRPSVEATWGWDDDQQRRLFDERFDPAACRVVVVEDEDAGVLAVDERADEVFLAELQLLPRWQNRGIGSDVLRRLARQAHESGRPLALQVLKSNVAAARLYRREGFVVVGKTPTHLQMRLELRG